MSKVVYLLFSVYLVSILVTFSSAQGPKGCEIDVDVNTCENDTETAVVIVGDGMFTIFLKLDGNGKAMGRSGRNKKGGRVDENDEDEEVGETFEELKRRKKRQAEEKKPDRPDRPGRPGRSGRPDSSEDGDDTDRPSDRGGKGPGDKRKGKDGESGRGKGRGGRGGKGRGRKRPGKACRRRLSKGIRKLMNGGKRFGRPLTIKFIDFVLDGKDNVTLMANPEADTICGQGSTALQDDSNANVRSILYEIPYDFNFNDLITAKGKVRVFVVQDNATIQGVNMVKGDIKWDLEVTDFQCTDSIETPKINCSLYDAANLTVLVDVGSKLGGKCTRKCSGRRTMNDGSVLAFPDKAMVGGQQNEMKKMNVSFSANQYTMRVNFRGSRSILVDPVGVPSQAEVTETMLDSDIEVGLDEDFPDDDYDYYDNDSGSSRVFLVKNMNMYVLSTILMTIAVWLFS